MENQNKTGIELANHDVIHTENGIHSLNMSQTFRQEALLEFIRENWLRYDGDSELLEAGLDCEVLQANGFGWQTGKVRLTFEFIPDTVNSESESFSEEQNFEAAIAESEGSSVAESVSELEVCEEIDKNRHDLESLRETIE